ncbi:MAG: N-acetyl sugar amidotransferase [Syntrophales bacterium LBB04]|nr:N-acetyl sugar amidotransferase [Syntrophales bacterium LBB04]
MIICQRCIYDERVSGISFDDEGICNYCRQVESLEAQYGTGQPSGEAMLSRIIKEIKSQSKNKPYNCVVGVSGGTDSSYLLMKSVEWGLRPLAVHYDNTWNSAVATENIRKITTALGVNLHTHVVDNKEVDDIKKAFLLSGVPEFDADTDIAFVQVLRYAAAKYGVSYILEGHSFKAEGLTPVGVNYLDGGYVADIHDKFGSQKRHTFPNMTFWQFMKWVLIYRQKFIRPLWYINYDKEKARDALIKKTCWTYYGGHHLENRASRFAHTVWLPIRFNIDYRNLTLAASVRAGKLTREEALSIYQTPIVPDPELIAYVKKRLSFSDKEFEQVMKGTKRSFRDFKTYKKRFELLRPLFYALAKANLVPMSFYLKYCFPLRS